MNMEKLIRYRKKIGMTQQDLAEKSGYSRSSIINWETGKRAPRTVDIEKLAEALGTTVGYLMGESDPQEAAQNLPINNAPENVNENGENLGLGYWGSVADNARKVAAKGDKQDSAIVVALLRKALNSFEGEEPTSGNLRNGVNQVIFGGRENKNEFNA